MLQCFHCVSALIISNNSKTFHSPCVSVLLNFSCVRSSSQCGSSTIILPATEIVRLITHRRPTMKYKPNLWWTFWHRTYYEHNDVIMLVFPLPHIHTAKRLNVSYVNKKMRICFVFGDSWRFGDAPSSSDWHQSSVLPAKATQPTKEASFLAKHFFLH